jgi:hypothetical protein
VKKLIVILVILTITLAGCVEFEGKPKESGQAEIQQSSENQTEAKESNEGQPEPQQVSEDPIDSDPASKDKDTIDDGTASQAVSSDEEAKTPLETKHFDALWSCQLSIDQSQLVVNGKQYKSGIVYTGKDGFSTMGGFVIPEGRFQKFGGIVCLEDNDKTTEEVTVKIKEKDEQGVVIKEIKVKNGEAIPFEIDISQLESLYVQNLIYDRVPKNTQPDKMLIADPYFK